MKKQKTIIFAVLSALILLLAGVAAYVAISSGGLMQSGKEQEVEQPDGVRSFADWTEEEIFEQVPALLVEGSKIGKEVNYGDKTFIIDVNGTDRADYQAYLATLEEDGFSKYVDNGENGLDGAVFTASYTKDDIVITVIYIEGINKTYVSACEDMPLSEHLHYSEEYVAGNVEGAKTSLHELELFTVGNSYVIQMKNGKFIVSDGGVAGELPYLIDYLESLAPKGEKPVVEAWFFTHPHADHVGIMSSFVTEPQYAERIYVEGVYYNEPGDNAYEKDPTARTYGQDVFMGAMALKTTEGNSPDVYRPQTGQRYYFNDITVDILMTQEQVLPADYAADINESSTWCMFTIDGQKVLFTGDADKGSMRNVMRTYSKEYLTIDIITAFHHSVNTWDIFTDYSSVKTVLVPRYGLKKLDTNTYLEASVDEVLSYGDGTKILTFPYTTGSAKSLANMKWSYHTEEEIAARTFVE